MSKKSVPPQPPKSPEEWAQAVVENISNNEIDETVPVDPSAAAAQPEPASVPTAVGEETEAELDVAIDAGQSELADQNQVAQSSASEDVQADIVESEAADGEPIEEEAVVEEKTEIDELLIEKERYLETSRRVQAEFENYRKQVAKRESEARARANESLITEILPVLDACDGAVSNGAKDVEPIHSSLLDILQKQGLEKVDPKGEPFDPEAHEAVMHDESDGEQKGPVVLEVLRPGYLWKGRVVRPSMVHVKG